MRGVVETDRTDGACATFWAKGIRQRVVSVFWAMRGLRGRGRLLLSIVEAGFGHLLADAAFFDEVLLQSPALLVEEVVGLMDEAEGDVGEDLGWTGVHGLAIGLVALAGGATEFAERRWRPAVEPYAAGTSRLARVWAKGLVEARLYCRIAVAQKGASSWSAALQRR